jgi:hypothetical protein
MVAATQLRGSSGDDDPDKSELKFIFTGKGPNDPVQRQAWLKRFAPYSMTIKVGKTYTPFNTTRMFESLGWQLAVAGALDDRDLNRQRGLLKAGEKAELIGAYIGSLTMRSSPTPPNGTGMTASSMTGHWSGWRGGSTRRRRRRRV